MDLLFKGLIEQGSTCVHAPAQFQAGVAQVMYDMNVLDAIQSCMTADQTFSN